MLVHARNFICPIRIKYSCSGLAASRRDTDKTVPEMFSSDVQFNDLCEETFLMGHLGCEQFGRVRVECTTLRVIVVHNTSACTATSMINQICAGRVSIFQSSQTRHEICVLATCNDVTNTPFMSACNVQVWYSCTLTIYVCARTSSLLWSGGKKYKK